MDRLRPDAHRQAGAAQGVPDGSAPDRRDRQHLQRRDPLRRRPALRPHERHPHDPGHPPALSRGRRGDARSREAPRFVARGRAVPRPVRTRRRLPERTPGVWPRGPRLPSVSKHDRTREVPGTLHLLLPQLPGLSAPLYGGAVLRRVREAPIVERSEQEPIEAQRRAATTCARAATGMHRAPRPAVSFDTQPCSCGR